VALALVAAREACCDGQSLVVVDRERRFYPPAAAGLGIELANTIFVRPGTRKEALWALHQALSSAGVGAVLAWPEKLDDRAFRALQLAAEKGGAAGLFVRPTGVRGRPTWSSVQLLVEARPAQPTMPAGKPVRRLRIDVLRCRQGQAGGSVEVELNDETGAIEESCALRVDSRLAGATGAVRASGA
jgi:protein ImuA